MGSEKYRNAHQILSPLGYARHDKVYVPEKVLAAITREELAQLEAEACIAAPAEDPPEEWVLNCVHI